MRWLKLGLGRRQVEQDQGRQSEILDEVRRRFGTHVQGSYRDQAAGAAQLLAGDDGLAVAVSVLRIFADSAHAELVSQAGRTMAVDRRNYRPLWRAAGQHLRWPLFELPVGLFPYVHVAAAATVVGGQAKRVLQVADGVAVLSHLFEILDLTIDGWEFGRVWVDADAATLAESLIVTARQIHDAMGDPPPLPDPVRELMRRNNTIEVYAPGTRQVVGGFNPGKRMREILLT